MEANENKFNPFTAARRDKFKCALFCFRSYVEDTAMFIAIIGICLTVVFALLLHDIDPHGREGRGIHATGNNDTAGIQLFLGTLFSMCLNFGVIAALITRIPAFCAPYLLVQLISLGMVGYRFAENGLIAIDTSSGSHFSQWQGISDNDRSIALNSFVLLGLLLLFDMWIFSIVWRAMRAIGWERTSKKLVQDLVEHQREGRRQQTSQPSVSAPVHSIA